jgi:tetratricopeptide (TPR) repeat protein
MFILPENISDFSFSIEKGYRFWIIKRLFSFRLILVLLLGLIITTGVEAQESFKEDSLLTVYKSSDDPITRINALIDLSIMFGNNDIEKNLEYANKALEEALLSDNYMIKAQAYSNLGVSFMGVGAYDKATELFLKSKALIEQNDDIKRLAGVVINLGAVRFMLGDMDGALSEFHEALELNNKLLETGDSTYVSQMQIFYINIGSVYEKMNNNKAAIEYMNKAIEASVRRNDSYHLAMANNNLGEIFLKQKDYSKARSHIGRSLEIRRNINDLSGMAFSLLNLAELYIDLQKTDSAIIINQQAIDIGKKLNSLDVLKSTYEQKAEIFEKVGDYKSTNSALKNFYAIKDSLQNKSVIENTTRLRMEYEFAKIDQERERKHHIFTIKMYAAIALLILLLVIFILLFSLSRSRTTRIRTEKEALKMDLEIKNKELTTNVMYLLKKNELIGSISNRLLTLKSKMKDENKGAIQRIIFDLQAGAESDVWEEFELRFQQVHIGYYKRLQELAPDLTPSELKICAFLKLNMNSKEISSLIHQSTKSVEVKRSKIRKKLGLTNTDTNLVSYLNEI